MASSNSGSIVGTVFTTAYLNGYEALVNAIVADVITTMRHSKMPSGQFLLKRGLEAGVINIVGSIAANYLKGMLNVSPLDYEYIITSVIAVIYDMWFQNGKNLIFTFEEQMAISVIAHAIATGSYSWSAGIPYNYVLGNSGNVQLNSGTPLYFGVDTK